LNHQAEIMDLIFIFAMIHDSKEGDPATPLLFVNR
jgi:hypothetical protein